jgi:hypothetical protein
VVGSEFTKKAYILLDEEKRASTTVVHYFGLIEEIVETSHGNYNTTCYNHKIGITFTTM